MEDDCVVARVQRVVVPGQIKLGELLGLRKGHELKIAGNDREGELGLHSYPVEDEPVGDQRRISEVDDPRPEARFVHPSHRWGEGEGEKDDRPKSNCKGHRTFVREFERAEMPSCAEKSTPR